MSAEVNEDLENTDKAAEASAETDTKSDNSEKSDTAEKPELDFKTGLYIRELEKKVADYELKISDVREYVKRMESEIEQIRIRTQRDQQKNIDKSASDFFAAILPVVDDLERSLKSVKGSTEGFVEGVRLIHIQIQEILKKSGLVKIASVGVVFDPMVHEALTTAPVTSDEQDGLVLDEVKSGYKYKETVVRPAQVIVGKKPESGDHATEGHQA